MKHSNEQRFTTRGKTRHQRHAHRCGKLERDYFEAPAQTRTIRTNSSASAPVAIAARRLHGTFTEAHILAITQAICDYRRGNGIDGPLYMGKDTHALSGPRNAPRWKCSRPTNIETIIQKQ